MVEGCRRSGVGPPKLSDAVMLCCCVALQRSRARVALVNPAEARGPPECRAADRRAVVADILCMQCMAALRGGV